MQCVLVAVTLVASSFALIPVSAYAASGSADAAIVRVGLLTAHDFPAGWTETTPPSSPSTPDVSKTGRNCVAVQRSWNASKKLPAVRGRSVLFEQGTAWISDTVTVHRTIAAARAGLAYLEDASFSACIQEYHRERDKQLKYGVTYDATKRISLPNVGNSTIGFENQVTVTTSRQTSTFYNEVEDVLVGRTLVSFSFTGIGQSLLENHHALVESVITWVRAAEATT
jgi:hypothetical protein